VEKMTIKSRVMDFVKGMGEARYTDIIKFIVEDVHGMKYDPVLHRGYYSGAFSAYSNAYFLYPSKNEPRCLVKNKKTKKYYVIGRDEALKMEKEAETKALENKNFTKFYFYLKETTDFTDLNILLEGWNKYFDHPNAWTWTIEKFKSCVDDPKSRRVQIWVNSRILRDYNCNGQAYVDESNGHVIVRDNAGRVFMELLMCVFGTEFLKNRLTWQDPIKLF
jgi:hypothetical protein